MKEEQSCKYSLNDKFSVVASIKNTGEQGNVRMMSLKLYRVDDDDFAIATKKFAWPEADLPKTIKLEDGSETLVLKGRSNVAHVYLRCKLDSSAVCARHLESPAFAVPVYKSLSSEKIYSAPSLSAQVSECLKNNDPVKTWKALVRLEKNFIKRESPVEVGLSLKEQISLIKLIKAHLNEKSSGKMISLIISKHLITETRASVKLLDILIALNDMKNLTDYIRFMAVIDERIFSRCLKIGASLDSDDGFDLLELLKKPFDDNALTHIIHEELTVHEVIPLVQRLVEYCCTTRNELIFAKALKLLGILADSHCQRFIWEASCYDAIQKAANTIADMVRAVDLCRQLNQQLRLNDDLKEAKIYPNSDYIIRRIKLQQVHI